MFAGGKRRLYDAMHEDRTLVDKLAKEFEEYIERGVRTVDEQRKSSEIFSKGIPDSIFGADYEKFLHDLSDKYNIVYEDMFVAHKFYSSGWLDGTEEASLGSE